MDKNSELLIVSQQRVDGGKMIEILKQNYDNPNNGAYGMNALTCH